MEQNSSSNKFLPSHRSLMISLCVYAPFVIIPTYSPNIYCVFVSAHSLNRRRTHDSKHELVICNIGIFITHSHLRQYQYQPYIINSGE